MDKCGSGKQNGLQVVRCIITVEGAVQGVGFRPFVYRLAKDYNLTGVVRNTVYGVRIEAQGAEVAVQGFLSDLEAKKPKHAVIERVSVERIEPIPESDFVIVHSQSEGYLRTRVLPDIATCPECLKEMRTPSDRRYRYPFINCTLCGPRYTIIVRMPYDRANTSMAEFEMCKECREEYEDPTNRRFHAEPIACPECGPKVLLWDSSGKVIAERDDAIEYSVRLIKEGNILAVKGIGGFHLVVDARNSDSVKRLRERKLREEKPFALMYPNIDRVKLDCEVSKIEEKILTSSEAPIVLLRRLDTPTEVSGYVAPEQDRFGVMLPYSPLHHLLLAELGFPIVATSGNRSEEPICIDEFEALRDLNGIADYFLVHNRKILRAVDDSIVQVVAGTPVILRRARGYVPQPIILSESSPKVLLAVGGHLKNTVSISFEDRVIMSQHLGDLETRKSQDNFHHSVSLLSELMERKPEILICDAHPDYASTQWAEKQNLPLVKVQHHIAHAYAVMAEKNVELPVFAVIWDGTGFGLDETVWGGEFFIISEDKVERWGHFRTFPLPGGDKAVREPRRTAIGMLYELYGEKVFDFIEEELSFLRRAFTDAEWASLRVMLRKGINSPRTSSAGRIFDGISAVLNLHQTCSYEAQSAMALESLARRCNTTDDDSINCIGNLFTVEERNNKVVIDWRGVVEYAIAGIRECKDVRAIAKQFHWALADLVRRCAEMVGIENVILNGGCFQNSLLLGYTNELLKDKFNVYFAQEVPPNDGGISLGQVNYALSFLRSGKDVFGHSR